MASSSGKYSTDVDDESSCVTNYVNGAYHVLVGRDAGDLHTPRKSSDSSRRSSEGMPPYFIGKSHSSSSSWSKNVRKCHHNCPMSLMVGR